ncbi:hypothetical protein CDAR_264521 [Caerostris darwini]|uniref:Uncharacterized protein n=1 Tax=Caerostris darwini TaxID=1538125 RepID=A0AAV4NQ76_9ARAC|nr:hypothetical protein CDAR_264521 [Caerostris darwini]
MIWRSPGALLASHISHYCNLAAKSGLLKRARYISVINCVVKSGNLHKSRAYLKRRVKTTRGLWSVLCPNGVERRSGIVIFMKEDWKLG